MNEWMIKMLLMCCPFQARDNINQALHSLSVHSTIRSSSRCLDFPPVVVEWATRRWSESGSFGRPTTPIHCNMESISKDLSYTPPVFRHSPMENNKLASFLPSLALSGQYKSCLWILQHFKRLEHHSMLENSITNRMLSSQADWFASKT